MPDSSSHHDSKPVAEIRHATDPRFRRTFLITFGVLAVYLLLSLTLSFGPLKKSGYDDKKKKGSTESPASETVPSSSNDANSSY